MFSLQKVFIFILFFSFGKLGGEKTETETKILKSKKRNRNQKRKTLRFHALVADFALVYFLPRFLSVISPEGMNKMHAPRGDLNFQIFNM